MWPEDFGCVTLILPDPPIWFCVSSQFSIVSLNTQYGEDWLPPPPPLCFPWKNLSAPPPSPNRRWQILIGPLNSFPEPVEVTNVPLSIVTLQEFDAPVRVNCSARGVPMPNITWYKDGVAMPTRTIIDGDEVTGELNLERLRPEEQGDYKCVGTTSVRNEPFTYTTTIGEDSVE